MSNRTTFAAGAIALLGLTMSHCGSDSSPPVGNAGAAGSSVNTTSAGGSAGSSTTGNGGGAIGGGNAGSGGSTSGLGGNAGGGTGTATGGAAGTGAGTGSAGGTGGNTTTSGTGGARSDGGTTTGAGGASDAGRAVDARAESAAPITPYVPQWPCVVPTWPTPTGSAVSITSTRTVAAGTTYDGHMALHNGSGSGDFARDCSAAGTAAQGTTSPLFQLEDGATIQNVIIGNHGADGIHCSGTCTIKNVWFQFVCDDAVTAVEGSSGTVTVDGGGAMNAHDKLFQDNSHGKFVIQNFFGQKLGKMYRACGQGGACGTTKGNLTVTNVTAIGVDQIAGVTQGRDTATFSKVCTFQTPTICDIYDSNDNAITDGPDGKTCIYNYTDTQVMLNMSTGVFPVAAECPNYLTTGSSTNPATACISTLPQCIKGCAPGDNGIKMCDCTGAGNTYHCNACAGPSQDPAKSGLDPVKMMAAPACAASFAKGAACSPEWDACKLGTQFCSCVFKPGTLQTAPTVWDCVNQWW